MISFLIFFLFFFFNDTATTEIYTLSLHDALPISIANPRCSSVPRRKISKLRPATVSRARVPKLFDVVIRPPSRSEEHTSELQSRSDLVCRLLLEKKKKTTKK